MDWTKSQTAEVQVQKYKRTMKSKTQERTITIPPDRYLAAIAQMELDGIEVVSVQSPGPGRRSYAVTIREPRWSIRLPVATRQQGSGRPRPRVYARA